MFHIPITSLASQLGNIDIYLFDQLLKGRITKGIKLLDAGCGAGRNIQYMMQAGVNVYGTDISEEAIEQVKGMAATIAPTLPTTNFIVADVAQLPFQGNNFEVVICSVVLHFAKGEKHFRAMFSELWRVLAPNGMLLCRLSTTIGMEGKLIQVGDKQYQMPHGPVWFLADELLLHEMITEYNAKMLEPLKTVLVEDQRSMTTLVLKKQNV